MPTRLTGTPSFASLGVQAPQPPNIVAINRAPTVNDFATFNTGDLWINTVNLTQSPPTAPSAQDIWMLVSKNKQIANATWINFSGGIGPGGPVGSFLTDDNLVEVPIGAPAPPPPVPGAIGQMKVFGGATAPNVYTNINTRQGADVNTVDVDLNNSIGQPNTNTAATQGMYALGGANNFVLDRFMYNYGTHNTFLGNLSGNLGITTASAQNNTCIGFGTGNQLTTANQCTFVGSLAGASNQTSLNNTFVGYVCGTACNGGGGKNTAVGSTSSNGLTTGTQNSSFGDLSLGVTTGSNNCAFGYNAGSGYTGNESSNISIGVQTNTVGKTGENGTIRIITALLGGGGGGTGNIFIGQEAGNNTYTTANNNTGVGPGVLAAITTASGCVFMGSSAGAAATTSVQSTGVGTLSLLHCTTGSANTAVGDSSLGSLVTGSNNCAFGFNAGGNYTGAESKNICIGGLSTNSAGKVGEVGTIWIGNDPAGATQNIFIGNGAGNVAYTTANNFTALGTSAAASVTTAIHSVALGNGALNAGTSCDNSVAVGSVALGLCSTGIQNTAIGAAAGGVLLTGSNNCYFGNISGAAHVGAERDNIIIGASVPGVAAETNALHIGAATGNAAGVGNLNKAFICGIRGITTGVNDAVAVLVDSANQLGTVSSTREVKDNINDMGSYSNVLYDLRPVTFNYKQHTPDVISVGLIAEEVEEVMPRLVAYQDDKPMSVKYHDLPAMLLNELQKLEKRVSELEKGCKCQTSV
jgi:hypothetical protein